MRDLSGLNKPLNEIIEDITPLNNFCRSAGTDIPAYLILEAMWDIGQILLDSGVTKVHPVAWEIQERSYITRDFVTYCYRVRKYFNNKKHIRERFSKIQSHMIFREALPMLENKKYKISGKDEKALIKLMSRQDIPVGEIRSMIAELKKKRIPRKNPRTQRLWEALPAQESFHERIEDLRKLFQEGSADDIKDFASMFSRQTLLTWNKLCLALSSDTFAPPSDVLMQEGLNENWATLIKRLQEVAAGGSQKINRLRRLIDPKVFVEMGSYVNLLRNDRSIEKYVERR